MPTITGTHKLLDEAAIDELERLLSIPLDPLVFRVLDLEHCSDLLTFLPWNNYCQVAVVMLMEIQVSGKSLMDFRQIE